ncbi:MAG: 5'-nucleotidase C-terminal domain-containing protein [Bacteroidaceae bacterium]|nr:5'-nucleotidase C-terminal domain-containing protein [Bacteroidaceae bacterium]
MNSLRILLLSFFLPLALCAQKAKKTSADKPNEVTFSLVATSDVHGNFFPYDFVNQKPGTGSLSRVSTYLKQLRAERGRFNVIYMDNGDILQGQPSAYYYNHVATSSPHPAASMINYLDALCGTVGNHDIETGASVYERWMNDCAFANLGANVFNTKTGRTAFTAYIMEEIKGVQVGVLGLITPSIPSYVPEAAWKDMQFRDMLATAQRVVPIIRRAGKADIVVVLMHSGLGPSGVADPMLENAAQQIAEQVPNVDLIFCGHDHRMANLAITNKQTGKKVLVLNPGANADYIAQADFTVKFNAQKKVQSRTMAGRIVSVKDIEPDPEFMEKYKDEFEAVKKYTSEVIGHSTGHFDTRGALFGSTPLLDYIHSVQLKASKADISMAAPLAFDISINEGDIKVADLFKLYKYENTINVVHMTGAEVKKYLEESYAIWTNQMSSPSDHMILLSDNYQTATDNWQKLKHSIYNFDSAAGIRYEVDLRKPKGEKVTILSMENGSPFSPQRTYKVAMSSYRASGGGGHLKRALGVEQSALKSRVKWVSPHDMRHYIMQDISAKKELSPKARYNWNFVPAGWADNASERDATILYGDAAQ